jgi:peptide/nickel transport system substrate-binding protein
MKRFFLSLLVLAVVQLLPALGQSQTPKRGGTLVFGLERELSTFNPFVRAGGVDLDVRSLVYESLLDKDINGKLIPSLAESWTISKDGILILSSSARA